ncbi:ATP-dependent helicase HrpB [Ferrovibrio sp.]|uniref:ATP-dependent helicase HrpB n=1 Tax=Ferrovibrio sp. TaxID=1917215 RepID=UPI000CB8ACD2|nr:ATP-dependent helicase HrpB [Ferrovibrio sp.]PJI38009.1 MAG: ATP-dependent helicase HrpB [Ferrovibrio sp.]
MQLSHALPIQEILAEVRANLSRTSNLVVQAPPGSGKTTLLPLSLLDEAWAGAGRIIVLEPRRLAARMAARRMADLLGEAVGETVGYRVRLDTKVGPKTRIELNTDGVFLRRLQRDPELQGVSAVLFDECHERGLDSDASLALCLEAQAALRPDLRLIAMSATLDAAPFAALMGNCPVTTGAGQSYPVETHWRPVSPQARLDAAVAEQIQDALPETEGDLLVFLPGVAEIRHVERLLAEARLAPNVSVLPLYGDLPGPQQDQALQPSPPGRRKIVLSTSIAESSLTIEGVRVVVDSGYMRQPRFSPSTGMAKLETIRVSQASADQRRGRAGRLGPGICYRLWAEAAHGGLTKFTAPEIAVTDLTPLALDLAAWGVRDAKALPWLDPPPDGAMAYAQDLLRELEAVDEAGVITPHGKAMAELPLHPRLAHMVIRGHAQDLGGLACALAALLGERDIARVPRSTAQGAIRDADLRWRLEIVAGESERHSAPHGLQVDMNAVRQIRQLARDWRRQIGAAPHQGPVDDAGLLVALAYPDRVAKKRGGGGSFLLSNGRGARLDPLDALSREEYLAVAEVDGAQADARVFLAAPIDEATIEAQFGAAIAARDAVEWDDRSGAVLARRQRRLGALVLREKPLPNPPVEAIREALLEAIAKRGLDVLPWTPGLRQWQARVALLRQHLSEATDWPDMSDAALIARLADWLGPYLDGVAKLSQLSGIDLHAALTHQLDYAQQKRLEAEAPTHWQVPSGSSIPLDYVRGEVPVLPVRLQEMFGYADTPAIAGGRVKLVLHLLSPARRPLQVTSDLAGFWQTSYRAVRAEMRGQYPKHDWPENPLAATPTARAKPRMR